MYYYNDFVPYHMFGFGFFFMILFWGFVGYGIYLLLRGVSHHNTHKKPAPIDILKERYAQGEITKEEFDSIKKDIE